MTFPSVVLAFSLWASVAAAQPRTLQMPRRWFSQTPAWSAALPKGRITVLEEIWRKNGGMGRHCYLSAVEVSDGAAVLRRMETMLAHRNYHINRDADGTISTQEENVLGTFRIVAGDFSSSAETTVCVEDQTSDLSRMQHALQGELRLTPLAQFATETGAVFAHGKRRSSVGEPASAEVVFVVDATQSLAAHRWLEAHHFKSSSEGNWHNDSVSVVEDTEREEMAFTTR